MRLPSGITIDDRLGIDEDLNVTEGYDNALHPRASRPEGMDDEDWAMEAKMSPIDQIAMGEAMVARWQAFVERAKAQLPERPEASYHSTDALPPTAFGIADPKTGEWKPREGAVWLKQNDAGWAHLAIYGGRHYRNGQACEPFDLEAEARKASEIAVLPPGAQGPIFLKR